MGRIVSRPDPRWRWAHNAAAQRLTEIGGAGAEAALAQRFLNPIDPPWRKDAGWLHRNRDRMVPFLMQKVDDKAWRSQAAYALGELRAEQAVVPLCSVLASGGADPVSFIEALGKIGSAVAVPVLLDQVRHDNHLVRDHALRALDRIGDPRLLDAAIAARGDPHPEVRDRAARVLSRHADERAVPELIRMCDTSHAARAAEALARVGDARALPALWRLFGEAPDRRTRHAAGRAIARIGGPIQHIHGADLDLRVRRAFTWLLGHNSHSDAGYLTRALTDADPITRARAIAALARRGDARSADAIQPLVQDPDPRVRANAATALGTLGERGQCDPLEQASRDPHRDVREAAIAALRRAASKRSRSGD